MMQTLLFLSALLLAATVAAENHRQFTTRENPPDAPVVTVTTAPDLGYPHAEPPAITIMMRTEGPGAQFMTEGYPYTWTTRGVDVTIACPSADTRVFLTLKR